MFKRIYCSSREISLPGMENKIAAKISCIARHFSYDNDIELIQFIASEMRNKGLDPNDEANLDSYLNTKFM